MGCGIVRKIDDLGRVVLPREMRRILNIKTGSSVEMNINQENKIVISKFSEIENISPFANILGQLIFEKLNLSCLICDDENVLYVFGANKKDFLHKKISGEKLLEKVNDNKPVLNLKDVFNEEENDKKASIFYVVSQGFNLGYVFVLKDDLTDSDRQKIRLLIDFFTKIMDFG